MAGSLAGDDLVGEGGMMGPFSMPILVGLIGLRGRVRLLWLRGERMFPAVFFAPLRCVRAIAGFVGIDLASAAVLARLVFLEMGIVSPATEEDATVEDSMS